MNAMESKICERCCDYFSRKIGSQVSECLDCKNEIDGDELEKPPNRNLLIIYVDTIKGNMELMYGFSSGIFINGPYSPLCITRKYNREPAFAKWDMTVSRWYCPSTDQKVNWSYEWTPEEFRK